MCANGVTRASRSPWVCPCVGGRLTSTCFSLPYWPCERVTADYKTKVVQAYFYTGLKRMLGGVRATRMRGLWSQTCWSVMSSG
jgi:hypothetical protein